MISVVIPLYNKDKYIANTLLSVFQQTYQDFEIVIVDDGSTDNSVTEVEKNVDSRIRLIHQQNAGVAAARNRGIEEARSELIAFLDADDEWKPQYLETQYALYKKYPECSVYACNYEFRDSTGKISPTIIRKLPFAGEDGILTNYFEIASCSTPPICSISIMARKKAIQAVGGFPIGIKSGEDLLTWAKLATKHKIAYNCRSLATFVNNPSDAVQSKSLLRAGQEDFILKELLKLYKEEKNPKAKKNLKSYVIRWYKIYTILLIENYDCHKTLPLGLKAILFGGHILTFMPIIFLGILPHKLAYFIFFKIRR